MTRNAFQWRKSTHPPTHTPEDPNDLSKLKPQVITLTEAEWLRLEEILATPVETPNPALVALFRDFSR